MTEERAQVFSLVFQLKRTRDAMYQISCISHSFQIDQIVSTLLLSNLEHNNSCTTKQQTFFATTLDNDL